MLTYVPIQVRTVTLTYQIWDRTTDLFRAGLLTYQRDGVGKNLKLCIIYYGTPTSGAIFIKYTFGAYLLIIILITILIII